MLPGCAATLAERPPAAVVAVDLREQPPAELLRCPERPEPYPEDAIASMPSSVRIAAIALARAFAANTSRLERLIQWHQPGACALQEESDG